MSITAALALAPVLAASTVLVADPFASAGRSRARAEDTFEAASDAASARKALRGATSEGTSAPASEAWRALRTLGTHDAAVQARIDALLPALPVVTGAGNAEALTHAYEQALRDAGSVPLTTVPGRRRGVLEIRLALRPNGMARAGEDQTWVVEAAARLRSADARAPVAAETTTRTIIAGRSARDVTERAPAVSAAALARALVTALARDTGSELAETVTTSKRTTEAVADLRERARRDDRVRAVLAAFPAQLIIDVEARERASSAEPTARTSPATLAVWDRALERAFVDVARGGLPVVLGPADYQVRVQTAVAAVGQRPRAGHASGSAWTARSTVQLTTKDGRVLAETHHDVEVTAASADEAARAGAVKVARGGYDAFVEQVVARINRLGQRRASR